MSWSSSWASLCQAGYSTSSGVKVQSGPTRSALGPGEARLLQSSTGEILVTTIYTPSHLRLISLVCAFLIVAAFVKSAGSSSGTQWYIVPTVGLSSLLLGVIYFSGLHCVMWYKGRQLVVERWPIIVKDRDEYIQTKEIVDFEWEVHQEKPKEHKMK